MDTKKLIDYVNQSGFPFQMAVANLIQETQREHGWRIIYKEHAWKNIGAEANGFVDLAIRDKFATSMLVIECKRVLDASWVFLLEDEKQLGRRHAKAWINCGGHPSDQYQYSGWADIALDPTSPESTFCVVRGQDAEAKPMLERIAAELVAATEAVAAEERPIQLKTRHMLSMYFPTIITTAKLYACVVGPSAISLKDGKVREDDATISEVPFVRFRKQLSTHHPLVEPKDSGDPFDAFARFKERTIFVVNAESLANFLREFECDSSAITRAMNAA